MEQAIGQAENTPTILDEFNSKWAPIIRKMRTKDEKGLRPTMLHCLILIKEGMEGSE